MSFDLDTLYRLLPSLYRLRDEASGEPLKAYLSVLADQIAVLENDLDQLYEDQFIETAAEWAVPYIGDVVGYRPLNGSVPGVRTPRAEVADTIALRRHKGTAAMLEVLARDVTGWRAHAVEFFQLLATTQYLNHLRLPDPNAGGKAPKRPLGPQNAFASVRFSEPLERLGGPFEVIAHNAEMRRASTRGGRYNIPDIGIYLWRLQAYPQTRTPAFKVDDGRYMFNILGANIPLFTLPGPEQSIDEFTYPANRMQVPDPIARRMASRYLSDYYGSGKSFSITVGGVDVAADPLAPGKDVVICDLSDELDSLGQPTGNWAHVPPADDNKVSLDPVLGRIAFGNNRLPNKEVRVTYQYGFSKDMGGGEYDRQGGVAQWYDPKQIGVDFQLGVTQDPSVIASAPDPSVLKTSIADALTAWNAFTAAHSGGFGMICVMDREEYAEALAIVIPEDFSLALVAADWPVDAKSGQRLLGQLTPEGRRSFISGDVSIQGTAPVGNQPPGTCIIDGALLKGNVQVQAGTLGRLLLSHCTVTPWTTLDLGHEPLPTASPRIVSRDPLCALDFESCILGGLRCPPTSQASLDNCVLDATALSHVAFADVDDVGAGGALSLTNCTVLGKVHTQTMEYASSCIFLAEKAKPDPLWPSVLYAERRQQGCVRYCYLPQGARLPRKFTCQPDSALQTLAAGLGLDSADDLSSTQVTVEVNRLRPMFTSMSYGRPGYAQLSQRSALEIRQGGENRSEMGAFHDLFQNQREENLRQRFDEYLRFGLEAGIFYAS